MRIARGSPIHAQGVTMASSIIRGKYVITRALDRDCYKQTDDGAVLQHDGVTPAIGE
jgi:hypothetical protein